MRTPANLLLLTAILAVTQYSAGQTPGGQTPPGQPTAARLELRDGDRIVLIGGTLIERDGQFGYLETAITAGHPELNLQFRNLGWSGDTVWGESRSYFGPPADGFRHLSAHVAQLKPTVLMVAYGVSESYAGEAGLPAFQRQLVALLDMLAMQAAPGARFVLLGPPRQEHFPPPLPDPTTANKNRRLYAEAIRAEAAKRGLQFIDLFELIPDGARATPPAPLTDNGIHYTEAGYRRLAEVLVAALGLPTTTPLSPTQLTALRTAINRKNDLYFHRWRPANQTYLFGFRKHEQGQNAREIPQFDPLVAAAEREIAKLRKPTP